MAATLTQAQITALKVNGSAAGYTPEQMAKALAGYQSGNKVTTAQVGGPSATYAGVAPKATAPAQTGPTSPTVPASSFASQAEPNKGTAGSTGNPMPNYSATATDAAAQAQAELARQANDNKVVADDMARKAAEDAAALAKATEAAKAAQEKYAADFAAKAAQRQAEISANAAEYQAEMQREKDAQLKIIAPLLDKEKEENQAQLASLKAKQDSAEFELKIKSDNAYAQSMQTFAKLGIAVGSAAITTAQQLNQSSAYSMAALKYQGALDYATTAKSMAGLEAEHQQKVESIVSQANVNAISSKDKASKDIYDVQNNLLLTEKQKSESIKNLTDAYIINRRQIENDTYANIRLQNATVQQKLDEIKANVEKERATATTSYQSTVSSGAWYAMSPDEQAATAKATGKSVSELVRTADSAISSNVSAAIQGMLGKSYAVPSDKYAAMIASVKNKLKLGGYSLDRAITEAVNEYVSTDATAKAAAARVSMKDTYTPVDTAASSAAAEDVKYIPITDPSSPYYGGFMTMKWTKLVSMTNSRGQTVNAGAPGIAGTTGPAPAGTGTPGFVPATNDAVVTYANNSSSAQELRSVLNDATGKKNLDTKSYAEQLSAFPSKEPGIGKFAVYQNSASDKGGKVGVVTGYNPETGITTMRVISGSGVETVNVDTKKIGWYFNANQTAADLAKTSEAMVKQQAAKDETERKGFISAYKAAGGSVDDAQNMTNEELIKETKLLPVTQFIDISKSFVSESDIPKVGLNNPTMKKQYEQKVEANRALQNTQLAKLSENLKGKQKAIEKTYGKTIRQVLAQELGIQEGNGGTASGDLYFEPITETDKNWVVKEIGYKVFRDKWGSDSVVTALMFE